MRARASKDLAQLADPEFFAAVSEGLALILKHTERLWTASRALTGADHVRGARILSIVAEEEAAKYLILIDAVRCPRNPAERLTRQLDRFNDHLAKGIYALACWTKPSRLTELQQYVDLHRDDFSLEGDYGEWIVPNEVTSKREGALYVDYFASETRHYWSDPGVVEQFGSPRSEPAPVGQARRLQGVGIGSPGALTVVAELWRSVPVSDKHYGQIRELNLQTLKTLHAKGLLLDRPQEDYSWVVNEWQFPMFDLDLSRQRVKPQDLRRRQREWIPD